MEKNSSPAIVDGVVYMGGSEYSHDWWGTRIWGKVYALNAATGAEKWVYTIGQGYTTGNEVTSIPAVANGVVYAGSHDGKIYALNATHRCQKWIFATGAGVTSSVAVANGIVYAGSNDNILYVLDADTGVERWRHKTGGGIHSSPAVVDSVVYVGSNDGKVYAHEHHYHPNASPCYVDSTRSENFPGWCRFRTNDGWHH